MDISLFIFTGELSGDAHGAKLLQALRKQFPNLIVTGVGGPDLSAMGVDSLLPMEDFAVMGFSDVLQSLPKLLGHFNLIRDHILKTKPAIALFIDSPGFSLRMARALRRRGFKGKIVQYISPSVWAWGHHRIEEMSNNLDLLLPIYPFESAHFAHTKLRVEYVGNPLQERIKQHRYDPHWQQLFGIQPSHDLIALFPGSRSAEIRRNLPKQLAAAKLIQQEYPNTALAISCTHEFNMSLAQDILNRSQLKHNREVFFIPRAYTYELMRSCRSAIAKSGTVTLELALHQCPTVVVYELSWLNWVIAKYALRIKLPFYCIVNILGGKQIFPELIEKNFHPEYLYQELRKLHADSPEREQCIAHCREVEGLLKETNASERAANAIARLMT